jgi:DNA-binding PadR family transcriptional regulator
MALDIFILSMLRAEPLHGYELKRRVQRPSLTPLSNNSLYPSLRRFEASGAVTKTVEKQEGRPARNVYAITDEGRRMLTELLSTLPPELAADDEEFLVRVGFFHELSPAQRLAILGARASVVDAQLDQVRALLGEKRSRDDPWRDVAMTQMIERLESERRWIAELAEKAGKP